MMARRSEKSQHRICTPARAPGEESLLLRWTELPGAELLHGNYRSHAFLPHWHDAYMFAASAKGAQRLRLRGLTEIVTTDVLLSLNPGELHDGEALDPVDGWRFRALYLTEELIRDVLGGDGQYARPVLESALQPNPALAPAFLRLHEALRVATSQLARESLLTIALPGLFPQSIRPQIAAETVGRSPGLERVREYIASEWRHPIALADLAALAGVSRYHLLRTFRSAFGLPPHAYQLQLRVRQAKELLFEGMPPSDVALEVGFFDQAHLTNTLRRFTGTTPGRLQLR